MIEKTAGFFYIKKITKLSIFLHIKIYQEIFIYIEIIKAVILASRQKTEDKMQKHNEAKNMQLGIDLDDIYVMCFNEPYTDIQRCLFIVGEDAAISYANNPHLANPKIYHARLYDNGLIVPDEERLVWEKERKIVSFYERARKKHR